MKLFQRYKTCDTCGQLFYRGIRIGGVGKRGQVMCEKCENVMKLMILKYRRKKEA